MSIGVIVGMATLTVAGAVTQKILEGAGKNGAAQFVEMATIAGLGTTALTIFATFIKAVSRLG
jgi:hypothetical protein